MPGFIDRVRRNVDVIVGSDGEDDAVYTALATLQKEQNLPIPVREEDLRATLLLMGVRWNNALASLKRLEKKGLIKQPRSGYHEVVVWRSMPQTLTLNSSTVVSGCCVD